MGLFKKKKISVLAIAKGQLLMMKNVEDPVFSSGSMGEGFAIEPQENQVYSPIEGIISSIFPTKHAIIIEGKSGLKILIHIGLDTGELNGEGFDLKVSEGEKVSQGDLIGNIDFNFIKEQGKGSTIVVVFLENDTKFTIQEKTIEAKQEIFEIEL